MDLYRVNILVIKLKTNLKRLKMKISKNIVLCFYSYKSCFLRMLSAISDFLVHAQGLWQYDCFFRMKFFGNTIKEEFIEKKK